ncbi:MAG TPA: NADH-quinone oxidoreductase subunit M [Egibacteraceae bacterium]|jgi:NADH-quinone oxidoreductase subunit M|nr:NADH-quinone oxidoreductase subunit M [Egibacteraceae bacterium]
MADLPLLTLLIVVPGATAAVIALLPAGAPAAVRWTALAGTVATFALSLLLLAAFTAGDAAFQLGERVDWIPQWGITYRLGVDGLSLFLVLLSTFMMPLVVLAGWNAADRVKGFFGSLMALQAALIGVFLALDLILFYVFFEAMLVPMYALIGIWGSGNRRYAAVKFFLYTLVGGFLMLVGILYLYFAAGATSFDYDVLRQVSLSPTEQAWLFGAFFAAFAIKVPMFPLHTWLPDAHTEAPTVGSVLLAAVMLKIGGYGFLRFSLPFFPDATVRLAPFMIALAVIGVLYGALVAMVQRDVKRLVAYSSVSHLGFVVLGVFALHPTGASGSVVQMVNHGLSTGALFLLIGFLYDRAHSRAIADYSGLLRAAPVLGGLFLLTAMSSIALPGLNGFVGEFPILLGAFQTVPVAAVAATVGVILAALYLLWAYQRMFHGPVEGRAVGIADLTPREIGVMVPIVALIIGIGLYPQPLYDRVNPTVEAILEEVNGTDGLTLLTPVTEESR